MKGISTLALAAVLSFTIIMPQKAQAGLIVAGIGTWGTVVSAQEKDVPYTIFGTALILGGVAATVSGILSFTGTLSLGGWAYPLVILDESDVAEHNTKVFMEKIGDIDDLSFYDDLHGMVQEAVSQVELNDDEHVYITLDRGSLSEKLDNEYDLTQNEKERILEVLTK